MPQLAVATDVATLAKHLAVHQLVAATDAATLAKHLAVHHLVAATTVPLLAVHLSVAAATSQGVAKGGLISLH